MFWKEYVVPFFCILGIIAAGWFMVGGLDTLANWNRARSALGSSQSMAEEPETFVIQKEHWGAHEYVRILEIGGNFYLLYTNGSGSSSLVLMPPRDYYHKLGLEAE